MAFPTLAVLDGNNAPQTINTTPPAGQTTMANALSVTIASDQTSVPIVGNVASGTTDSGNGVKVSAVYTSTQPTYTTGQRTDFQSDAKGNLAVLSKFSNSSGADGIPNSAILSGVSYQVVTPVGTLAPIIVTPTAYNGTTHDRNRKPNLVARIASTAASGNPAFLKASAGDVTAFLGQNGAAITYLQLYNKATAPVLGTDTPFFTYPIPANALFSYSIPNGGLYFGTGIAYAFTTDAVGATGAAAAAVIAFNLLAA